MNWCRHIFYGLIPVFLLFIPSYGQGGQYHGGARLYGMGNAGTALPDEWSAFYNISGISGVDRPVLAFTYIHRFNLKPLYSIAAVGVIPMGKVGNICATIYRFGDELYNEQKLSVGFANKIGFVRLGGQIHYLQINVASVGREGLLLFDFGGMVELIPTLSFGARIFNATATGYKRFEQEYFPVTMSAGLTYKPAKQVVLSADVEKITYQEFSVKFGLEYLIYEKVSLRGGFDYPQSVYYFGAGFRSDRLGFDYAMASNYDLGYIHQFSARYFLRP